MFSVSSVQSLSCARLFATPWTAACQASLSIINSQSLLKLMFIESVMPSNHLILCCPFSSCPQSLPASGSFLMSRLFPWGGQSIKKSVLRTDSFENTLMLGKIEGGRRRGQQRMRWLDGITDSVHHQLPELAQTHVHGDAIQPSHPQSSPSPPAFNLSQHQGLFKCCFCKWLLLVVSTLT